MQEKPDADIWRRLCRKKILVLGPGSDIKQKFLQICKAESLKISEDEKDMSPENYVIVFGFSDQIFSETDFLNQFSEEPDSGTEEKKDRNKKENRTGGWEMFSFLTRILRRIENVRPESVLFVSRSDVYGKLFGEFHPVKENELGYVCHTSACDQEAERLRLLENLCFRMAREDRIAVKIARFPDLRENGSEGQDGEEYGWKQNDGKKAGKKTDRKHEGYSWQNTGRNRKRSDVLSGGITDQEWKKLSEAAARILLDGEAGEAYNIERSLREDPEGEAQRKMRDFGAGSGTDSADIFKSGRNMSADTTALEPIRIVMDTGKAGRLE